jgi:hypothetical protein
MGEKSSSKISVSFYQNTLCEISGSRDIIYTKLYTPNLPFIQTSKPICERVQACKGISTENKVFRSFSVQEIERMLNTRQ